MQARYSHSSSSSLVYIVCIVNLIRSHDQVFAAEPVNNGIYGDPEIHCTSDSVRISVNTYDAFEGHLYVKGHYGNPSCRVDATADRLVSIQIPFSSCGVRRERTSNPPGLIVSAVIIVSFHPMFVTKTDKSYHVKCSYMLAEKPVTAGLDVSMFSTQVVTQNTPLPTCRYEVLEGGQQGTPLKFAMVGQEVYHKWSCESEIKEVYCMTVHSCVVDDGNNKKTSLLDENGCAQDKYLMNNLYYDNDLQGGVTNLVFKYADIPQVFFQCQIRLTYKNENGRCERTSDVCPWPTRGKRAVNVLLANATTAAEQVKGAHHTSTQFVDLTSSSRVHRPSPLLAANFDIAADQLTVLDILDADLETDTMELKRALSSRLDNTSGRNAVCLSPISLAVVSCLTAVVFLAGLSLVTVVWVRRNGYNKKHRQFLSSTSPPSPVLDKF